LRVHGRDDGFRGSQRNFVLTAAPSAKYSYP
jgi:hypothetical protein